jgi:tRNA (guanine37-N1)-methyltransferase
MHVDVVTLFPETFAAVTASGITRRALEQRLWHFAAWNPREFTTDPHRTVDDRPFGGGPGMLMMAELAQALAAARAAQAAAGVAASRVLGLSASGRRWRDADAKALAAQDGNGAAGVILVCGRYEGVDQRFIDACVDDEVSLGDYVLSGGELAAMVLIDTVVRQLPGALKTQSVVQESFADGLLDAPQYTRPEAWRGRGVPEVLLSGHHAQIARWRRDAALRHTARRRPDLIESARRAGMLDAQDEQVLRRDAQDPQALRGFAQRGGAVPGDAPISNGTFPSSGGPTTIQACAAPADRDDHAAAAHAQAPATMVQGEAR